MSRRSARSPLAPLPLVLFATIAPLAVGCATGGPSVSTSATADASGGVTSGREATAFDDHAEERALLLLLADRQTYEPLVVRRGLLGPADLREDLAVALGRSGDPRGLDSLLGLLLDDEATVRRAAAFALGELGERLPQGRADERRRAAAKLLDAVADPDRDVGTLAVEALGKLGVTIAPVAARVETLEPEEGWPRLLPALYRYPDPETPALASAALVWIDRARPVGAEDLRRRAVYALTRTPRPESLETIRGLLGEGASPGADPSTDPSTDPNAGPTAGPAAGSGLDGMEAAWVARALGRIGTGARDLELLRPLLDRTEPEPIIAALAAARMLVADGRAAAGDDWRERLVELLDDPRPGVRMTAIDAASAWLLDPRLARVLEQRVTGSAGVAERGEALLALATGGEPRAEGLAASAAGSSDPRLRARAAEAAAVLGAEEILDRLAGDRSPTVRGAVLAARLAHAAGTEEVMTLVRAALADPDTALRTAALGRLAERPVLPVAELARAWATAKTPGAEIEERLAVVAAVVARGAAVGEGAREREDATALLLDIGADAEHAVRVRVADGLGELGLPRPPVGPVETGQGVAVYRRALLETATPRTVDLVTGKGTVRIRLACPRAPLTCLSFLRLANQGFYDGLELHRVVPGFVVQGGDPRGDGLGGPGYVIRDEINRLRFDRAGVVGMALAGPDTGGSQFFVTLAPQPHLDGGYTAFGEVVEGVEVLDRIVPGDRIETIREVSASASR